MMDKSIPHMGVLMTKTDLDTYPGFGLPAGFHFSGYRAGFEEGWADLMLAVEQFDSLQQAKDYFREEFLSRPELLERQCLFVLDGAGGLAATASVWPGNHFGRELLRIHWVACAPAHQGKGLAKALVTKLLDTLRALQYRDLLYLTSQTWSYKALRLYAVFGFEPYRGEKPVNWTTKEGDFERETKTAWGLIFEKIEDL